LSLKHLLVGLLLGPTGPQGATGTPGQGLSIKGVYATLGALQAAQPTGSIGDGYLVGPKDLYIWVETKLDLTLDLLVGPTGPTGPSGGPTGPTGQLEQQVLQAQQVSRLCKLVIHFCYRSNG
jgi:hypothetical protein